MELDRDQKRAVLTEDSAVVSAGAGSGKTTVLTSRFVHLVKSRQAEVDQILTLTFTRKAAAEMYERIYQKLLQEVPSAAEQYDQAAISTLDSFCGRIVRDRCEHFGLSRDFQQDDALVEELARSAALDVILREGKNPALQRIIDLFGFEVVLEELFVSLSREYFTLPGGESIQEELSRQHHFLEGEISRLLEECEVLRSRFLDLDPSDGKTVAKAIEAMENLNLPEFSKTGAPGNGASDAELSNAGSPDLFSSGARSFVGEGGEETPAESLDKMIAALEKTGTLSASGLSTKKAGALLCKEYIAQWRTLYSQLLTALESVKDWPLLTSLGDILEQFRHRLEKAKRNAGLVTFRDVSAMAVSLLEDDPEFRRRWKERYRFIMIDEFQDNNDLQRRLLFLLAERPERMEQGAPRAEELLPGKLFFVGDEKQSIYRFRGAEVGVFKRLSRELASSGGREIELPRNYRSEPELIDFFNSFFPSIFGAAEEPFEARFRSLEKRGANGGSDPKIALFYQAYGGNIPEGEDPEGWLSQEESEAWYIAGKILSLQGEGRFNFNDMAILMRSGSSQISYERIFRRLGIPYTVQSPRALFLEAIAYDFYQILELLLYPEDRLAYAALLRSPFCALSDISMSRLIIRERREHRKPFSLPPEEIFPAGAEQDRYRRLCDLYHHLAEQVDRVPATELLRQLWFEGGYRYAVLRKGAYHSYLEYYDYLVEIARSYDRKGEPLSRFLAFLRENLGKFEKIDDVEISRLEESGVKMMSIHKSKGLQFPVVFVSGCGTTGHREHEAAKPYYIHPEHGLTLASSSRGRKSGKGNYFHQLAKTCQEEQEIAEIKRLLYVAATRAEEQLYFSGYHGRNNRNVEKMGRFSFINWIGAGLQGIELANLSTENWEDDPAIKEYLQVIPPVENTVLSGPPPASRGSAKPGHTDIESLLAAYRTGELLLFDFSSDTFTPSALSAASLAENVSDGASRGASGAETAGPEGVAGEAVESLDVDRFLRDRERITAFGTLCHQVIEMGVKNPGLSLDELPLPGVFQNLREKGRETILQGAGKLAQGFLKSDLGREARAACLRGASVSEVPFLYRTAGGYFIDGTIDLLLEREDEAVVIDFKSDRGEDPSHHLVQLALYREAAQALTGKPVSCLLWYLRSGNAVELDTGGASFDPDRLIINCNA